MILLAVAATLGASPTWSARLPPGAEHAIEQVSVDELCGHVTVLAGDGFMGRGVGHPGNRLAEVYVADALRRANVSPAGESYFQPIQVYEPALGAGSRLTIDAGDAQPIADFTSGLDFYPLPASSDTPVSGPLVYAGYGISAPRWGHDDYKKIDARGAVVLVKEDYDQEAQHLVRRSDNWPFLEHGVPAIFLTTGLHPDYHTPADDTDRIDFGKLERITELAGRATWLAADGSAPRLKTK